MKEFKRYKLVATESSRNVIECNDGHWVRYADYDYVLNLLLNQYEASEEEASMKVHLLRNSVENNKRITKVSEENKRLQARIKEMEAEKETRYLEGKSEIISKLINDVPNPNYINDFFEKFSVYTPRGDDDEDVSWDVDKLKQYFDIERNFTSSYEKFQQILDDFHWGAMALEDNCVKKRDFINYIIRKDTTHNLENYIKHKINEFKAQGISEAIKGFRTFAISNNVNLTCEDFDEYLCEQVNKLRAKHD